MNNSDNKIIDDALRVFFIVSNESNIDNDLQYSLINKGMVNLKKIISKDLDNNMTASVYSLEFISKELEEKDKDQNTKKYKALINVNYKNLIFKGIIFFKEIKNNFIYDFKFEKNEEIKNLNLMSIEFSKLEQLKMYEEVLKKLKVKPGDNLLLDLVLDSQVYFMGNNNKYYFDFYLEVFKLCYSRREIKTLLMMFRLERVKLPDNIEINNYFRIMYLIEKKPDILTKYCNEIDSKNKLLKNFYTLLLYFRANYEKEKVSDLLNKQELWKFYIEILPKKHEFFSNIEIPEELINEILRQNRLTFDIIKDTFSYIHSNKDKLITLNNNIDSIFEFCKKETKLKITDLIFPKETDNLTEIIPEIEKILKSQNSLHEKYILFDAEFWQKYTDFNKNNQDIANLIKRTILLYINYERDYKNREIQFNRKSDIIDLEAPIPLNRIKEEENKNENNIIDKRLAMPAIGNVSVGKSYFLNSILGNDFCQVKSDITTKFILFIRHIDKLKEPRLYNIKPVANNNSYAFVKNSEVITGENNIKEKIKSINNKLQFNEESMFYMLEIEIKTIKNKEFLNKVDFLDVPGLNEAEVDYINLYFKYIKDMIKYCLIIFSTENYNSKDALEVINKIKNNIYVPMKNFLLILNKIDKVDGKIEETLHDFKKVLLYKEVINFYDNTIIPVNSIQLKSEMQIETNFYHFINYYFIEYNNNVNNENRILPFLEFIKNKIKNVKSDKKKILRDEIKSFDEKKMIEIKNVFSLFANEMKIKGHNLMIDLENNNEMNTLKIFYICFTKKILVPKTSNALEKINNYFDNIKDYEFPLFHNGNEIENEAHIDNKLEDYDNLLYSNEKEYILLKKLDNFFIKYFNSPNLKKFGRIVDTLNNDFQILKNYILNSSLIYIPIIGASNSGKSSFINCLIQKDILTCKSSGCTRRGMIIKYIKDKDKTSIYSIKFKSSKCLNQEYYYYTKNKLLSNKIEDIKEIIDITNESYPKNEEDCFFLLETNIQALDDLNIKPEIKNNICFIDFPGYNTNNNYFFDNNIYQNVLKMCSFFIYINGGKAFKEDGNKIFLSKIFSEVISSRKGDISPKEYLELCLFIFNKVDSLEENERNFENVEEDIKGILGLPNYFESNISCTFFSALIFKKYLEKKNYYNPENIIEYLSNEFQNQEEEIDDDYNFFGFNNKERDLTEFIKINILKYIDFDFNQKFNNIDKNNILSSKIYKDLKDRVEQYYQGRNIIKNENYENNLITISELLISCQQNLTKLNYYKGSYAKETFGNIYSKINKSFYLKKEEYDNHLERFFYFMSKFFRLDNVQENEKFKSEIERSSVEYISNIEKIFEDFKNKKIIDQCAYHISECILKHETSYNELMQQNENNIEKIMTLVDREIISEYIRIENLINEELINLKITIIDYMEKEGIDVQRIKIDLNFKGIKLEREENNNNYSLFSKILYTFQPVYGLIQTLPKFIVNNFNKERAFNNLLNKKFYEAEEKIKKYKEYIDKKIEEYRQLSMNNANRLFYLREANNIEIDDFWREAKGVYIDLYNQYINKENN